MAVTDAGPSDAGPVALMLVEPVPPAKFDAPSGVIGGIFLLIVFLVVRTLAR